MTSSDLPFTKGHPDHSLGSARERLVPPQTSNYVGLFQPARERDSVSGNAFINGLEPLPQFLQLLSCHCSRPKAGPQLGYPSCYPEIVRDEKGDARYAVPSYWSQTPMSESPECPLPERPRHQIQGTLFPHGFRWQNSESLSSYGEA